VRSKFLRSVIARRTLDGEVTGTVPGDFEVVGEALRVVTPLEFQNWPPKTRGHLDRAYSYALAAPWR